jgi:hypothetical protein
MHANRRYRVDKLIDWITRRIRKGLMRVMFQKEFSQEFGGDIAATKRAFARDYKAAMDLIRRENGMDKEDRFAQAVLARQAIISRALECGDLKTALSGEKDMAELEGLYKEDKGQSVTVVFNDSLPIAPDPLEPVPDDMLEEYKRQVGLDEED